MSTITNSYVYEAWKSYFNRDGVISKEEEAKLAKYAPITATAASSAFSDPIAGKAPKSISATPSGSYSTTASGGTVDDSGWTKIIDKAGKVANPEAQKHIDNIAVQFGFDQNRKGQVNMMKDGKNAAKIDAGIQSGSITLYGENGKAMSPAEAKAHIDQQGGLRNATVGFKSKDGKETVAKLNGNASLDAYADQYKVKESSTINNSASIAAKNV